MKVKNERKGMSLVTKLISLSILPVLIIGILLCVVAVNSTKAGIGETQLNDLDMLSTSVAAAYDALDPGDYWLNMENNHLMKGEFDITLAEDIIDEFVEGTQADVTLFYDNTRYATSLINTETNKRILGTTCSDEVYEAVINRGEVFHSDSTTINNMNYYVSYRPLKNSDGKIIGMSFAGIPSADVDAFISEKIITLVSVIVLALVLVLIVVIIMVRSIVAGLKAAQKAVIGLAEGDLTIEVDKRALKRKDELGQMVQGVQDLKDELVVVMGNITSAANALFQTGDRVHNMAGNINVTSVEISKAVEGISQGATSQAEDIEIASGRIDQMGMLIENIVDGVANLNERAGNMKVSGDDSIRIVNELSVSNDKTMEAVDRIAAQVIATNESANKISEAVSLIKSIAEETNLLSLNASIESARAGEQGRGFAVVADQIRKLAEQSSESTASISHIIDGLLSDSETTVNIMKEVQAIVNEQSDKLMQTKAQFQNVSEGIDASNNEVEGIRGQTRECDNARAEVIDVISNLSAISEENAASTEETTASVEEMTATIQLLADEAEQLQIISKELEGNIKFFKL
ncbi:MAG: HAMP domain-containing protein [Lachnospiraceae bacterium]|nr:HAMP domain-containing protein [Lachnospiraceae bacterium]